MQFDPKETIAKLLKEALELYGGDALRVQIMYSESLDDAGETLGQDPNVLSDESARVVAGALALRLYVEKQLLPQTTWPPL